MALIKSKIRSEASISKCGIYRWSLSRCWDDDPAKPWLGWIMLNPSAADAIVDDPTIRRCMRFAYNMGFAGISVRNLFAIRTAYPSDLKRAADPVGVQNDAAIMDLTSVCTKIVVAWGSHDIANGRDRQVKKMFSDAGVQLYCLGVTKHGHPRHPLYISAEKQLEIFS